MAWVRPRIAEARSSVGVGRSAMQVRPQPQCSRPGSFHSGCELARWSKEDRLAEEVKDEEGTERKAGKSSQQEDGKAAAAVCRTA